MRWISTRGDREAVAASTAMMRGLAPDGGLYVPEQLPRLPDDWMSTDDYASLAAEILAAFLDDEDPALPKRAAARYRGRFPDPVTPIRTIGDRSFLELYHGPTSSFKDMALTVMPELLQYAYTTSDRPATLIILVATSGDTGSAVLHGFASSDGMIPAVFYPLRGVSRLQMQQMEQAPGHAAVYAIEGHFDDAQTAVKAMLKDPGLAREAAAMGFAFTSANSINIARLLPQTVYYAYAYAELRRRGVLAEGEPLDVSVPTGNFGNILAAVYARRMGVPLGRIYCASNANDVLTRFLTTGYYDARRPLLRTLSPSMDILRSSNLERYLYMLADGDPVPVARAYRKLATEGRFDWELQPDDHPARLRAGTVDDRETLALIRTMHAGRRYLMDPHTAVAYGVARQARGHCLIVSTASPFKFPETVLRALDVPAPEDLSDQLEALADLSGLPVPEGLWRVAAHPQEARHVLAPAAMPDAVHQWLKGAQDARCEDKRP